MSVSISSCPKCKSLLLSDTVQCPECHYVLHPKQGVNLSEYKLHSEVMGSGSDNVACPDCGEMVRKEQACCAFLRFDLRGDARGTYLTITAPEGAGETANELFGHFAP